ncbi:major facilitator superfamily domain-containing protein [Rhexocercosporidium sp. MPI-PUGE-AT-0058]|nr:major facilitator superfamily domain-containing protein [Rhexocercosporidium sp. MPI-PUGE-AT-0058]
MSSSLSAISTPSSADKSSTDLKIEQSHPIFKSDVLEYTLSEKNEGHGIEGEELCLEPIDGGKSAWLFMVGAVIIDAIIWGFPLNFGVFQDYYTTHPPFEGNRLISMIGTFATGIAYLGGPLMTPITIRYHAYRRHMVIFGASLCVLGNIGASFGTQLWVMVVCQGVLYGIGFLIVSYATFSMLNEWFVKKRGLAYGIQLSAAGAGGLALPFLLQVLLEKYGYDMTLRIYAVGTVIIVGPAILLVRSRTRHMSKPPKAEKIDYSVLKKPIFASLSICNFLQGLVFYLPSIFLPSFAADISISPTERSILLVLMHLAEVIGLLSIGHVSDFVNVHVLLFGSSLGSAIVVSFLWGLSKTMLHLCFFSLLFGYMAGSFEALFPRFATALTDNPSAELTFFGFFEFQRGLGMVLAGPISSALIGRVVIEEGYGIEKYKGIILFVGSILFVCSFSGVGWLFRGKKWYR